MLSRRRDNRDRSEINDILRRKINLGCVKKHSNTFFQRRSLLRISECTLIEDVSPDAGVQLDSLHVRDRNVRSLDYALPLSIYDFFFFNCWTSWKKFMFCFESKSKSCSVVWAPWTIQSMEFSRPEHLSGQLFLSPGDLPNPGIEPRSPTLRQILYQLSHQGSPRILKWVAYPSSSRSSTPRNWTGVSCTAGGFFPSRTTREILL